MRPKLIPATALVASIALSFMALSVQATETSTYVVSAFVPAIYSTDGDCPEGQNPSANGLLRQILVEQGVAPAEIEQIMAGKWEAAFPKYAPTRGRIDGKPADAYLHPMSAPDPPIKTVVGKDGLGFNLDGRVGPNDFIDPLTHETGVDNQLFRVLGCFERLRGTIAHPSTGSFLNWDGAREGMPAWLLQIDRNSDEDVYVRISRAFEPVTKDAAGNLQTYMTYTTDPDPRMQSNVFHGRIKNGMFVSDATVSFFMVADSYVEPVFDITKSRLRISFNSDGSVVGYLGGYTSIAQTYLPYAQSGAFTESTGGINAPGVYQALRKFADGDPNPATGERDRISATYQLSAVPAFSTAPLQQSIVATAGRDHLPADGKN